MVKSKNSNSNLALLHINVFESTEKSKWVTLEVDPLNLDSFLKCYLTEYIKISQEGPPYATAKESLSGLNFMQETSYPCPWK